MSTHFRPRPPTPVPPSPVRPSTARSTIRVITPSPPPSLDEAPRLNFASSDTPENMPSRASARSKSDGFHATHVHDSGGGVQEPFATYVMAAENVDFSSSPETADLHRDGGGGGISARTSPVKRILRSKSPRKRPYSTPTGLPSHQESPHGGQDQEQTETKDKEEGHEKENEKEGDDEDDASDTYTDAECPDTPTPMTTSQKRSAYFPLGIPIPYSKRESKHKDSPETVHTPSSPTPPSSKPDMSHTSGPGPTLSRKPGFDFDFRNTHTSALASLRRPLLSSLAPSPSRHAANHALRKPVPASNLTRHISISAQSQSAQSNISGASAASKRSIFSTPGRDELERKMTVVKADEGPFARAVSVADLNDRRRAVSGKMEGGDGERREKGHRVCGMGFRCSVM
ncbi:hypothetical protein EJ02DRAFT_439060 [Clathrospora elynae]|uniref:Uncharacterized protein n=1 Tax=Clathrospora elynae TaxID=706981 RepID=A0A6A5S856_9PLEO|nr:hypothetical protein EJ02DRAFT_439060 [Clathrospora elynae]